MSSLKARVLAELTLLSAAAAFAPGIGCTTLSIGHTLSKSCLAMSADDDTMLASSSRAQFLRTSFQTLSSLSVLGIIADSDPACARGRATLEQSYDRYTPRIVAGGKFYANDLRNMIAKNDWKGLEEATSDPPKKTKADRSKVDGGISERAALAGGFSDARVIVACDLYASAFSDSSITSKTKAMKVQVEKLRQVVQGINLAAREALGKEKGSGGLFGLGAKTRSQSELQKEVRQLYVDGGNYWNQYVFDANEGLPVTLKKLSYL